MDWTLVYTHQAKRDARKLAKHHLKKKACTLLEALQKDPFVGSYEALIGDLKGAYSRRISIQHRLVYQVCEKERVIKIIRLWTHYE